MNDKAFKACRRVAALALAIAVAAPTMGGVKAEYKFNGWVLDGNGAKLYREGEQVPITKGLGNGSNTHTFQAKWEHLYTVVIDCDGGTITPGTGWTADGAGRYKKTGLEGNSRQSLPSNEPALDGYEFAGWQIEGHAGKTYTRGESFNVDPSLATGYVITFRAVWEPLSCIHTDSWATIIQNAKTNPEIYRGCVNKHCTKTVEIRFPAGSKLYSGNTKYAVPGVATDNSDGSHTVKYAVNIYGIKQDKDQAGNPIGLTFGPAVNEDYTDGYKCHTESDSKITGIGDGASMLEDSIATITYGYQDWNSEDSTYGGWPGSRIRATLNGSDKYTADGSNVDDGGGKIYYPDEASKSAAGTNLLSESDALISAFPAELRAAIVPKAVISDTKYNHYNNMDYTFTTYDKLWLFSGAEIFLKEPNSTYHVVHKNERIIDTGDTYDRADHFFITGPGSSYTAYDEGGNEGYMWLRTVHSDTSVYYTREDHASPIYAGRSYDGTGISPGFCIGSQ